MVLGRPLIFAFESSPRDTSNASDLTILGLTLSAEFNPFRYDGPVLYSRSQQHDQINKRGADN